MILQGTIKRMNKHNRVFNNHLLGLAYDDPTGHKRITKADKFSVIGGSYKTHQLMTNILSGVMGDLSNQGRMLEQLQPAELYQLIEKYRTYNT